MAVATFEIINLYPTVDEAELPRSRTEALPVHLRNAAPQTWIWCFCCERVFQLGESRVACPYFDCGTGPTDFWQWDAYGALTGITGEPALGVRYELRALAAA